MRRCFYLLGTIVLLVSCAVGAPPHKYAFADDGKSLALLSDGRQMLSYRYAVMPVPEGVRAVYARGGFIHPANTPSGFVLTEIQPPDHRHHYGIWNPWTRVEYDGKVYDLWNLGDSLGTVRAGKVFPSRNRRGCGFEAELEHVAFTPGGEVVIMKERWQVFARETRDGFLWDFVSTLTPSTDKPVTIKAYRYQGFCIRANACRTKDNCSMMTSEGVERPGIDGSRARWIYLNGATGPASSGGFLILAAPENYNAPEPLRIWDEKANRGRGDVFVNFCPAKTQDWNLEPGKSYRLSYRVLAFDNRMDPEKAERLWREFADSAKGVTQ